MGFVVISYQINQSINIPTKIFSEFDGQIQTNKWKETRKYWLLMQHDVQDLSSFIFAW